MTNLKKTEYAKEMTGKAEMSAGRPIRNSSLFYSLYYLSEIEGVEEASFDLFKLTNQLYDGFFAYGLHSITTEMDAIRNSFNIQGETVEQKTEREVVDYFEQNITNKNELAVIRAMMEFYRAPQTGKLTALEPWKSFAFIEQVAEKADDEIGWVSAAEEVYSLYDPEYYRAGPNDNYNFSTYSGWVGAYGGPGWEGVCNHILDRDELSKIAWVDHSWSVQHNGGDWIDKIQTDEKEFEVIAEEAVPEMFMKGTERSDLRFEDMRRALNDHLLDANLGGDMWTVFSYAEHYQDEVDINLTRYKNRLL